jgi:CheY-like chemotaxis protein
MNKETAEVFVVEDNPADVALIRVVLSGLPYPPHVLVAKDGEQALRMLRTPGFHPQLIILDLNMPRVDGQTVLQQYHQKDVPIVVFSSTENKVEVQRVLALGACEYVQKPIGFEPYADAVRGMVNRWIADSPEQPAESTNAR